MTPPTRRFTTITAVAALACLAAATLPATAAAAQTGPGPAAPYVVVMDADPVAGYDGERPGFAATRPEPGKRIDRTEAETDRYADHLVAGQDQALADSELPASVKRESFAFALNGFSAALTAAQARRLEQHPEVALVVRDQLRRPHTDVSPGFLGVDRRGGAWDSGYTGDGVIVGVIDTGIWPEHPSFADDGSYPAPPPSWMGGEVACEFGDTYYNPADAPFTCTNKLVGARDMRTLYREFIGPEVYQSARDYHGHGTHTASIAAGNRGVPADIFDTPRGTVSGIAPRAQVAAYSACGDQGCFGGDLAYAIDTAVADGVDVINYSIGGDPTYAGADDLAFLFANAAGVFVATSAGNAGPGPETLGSPAIDPWLLAVGASTHHRTFEGEVTLGDGRRLRGASLTGGTGELPLRDATDHANPLCDPEVSFEPELTGTIVLCARGEFARVSKSQAVFEQGGAGMVLFNEDDAQAQVTDNHFVPSVNIGFSDGQLVKDYLAAADDAVATIEAGEAVATRPSVMADFSSRGPVPLAESLIKPDVTAPGVNILAGQSPTPTLGAPDQLFQSISGTSMASPQVAGVLALLKQAHPQWSPAMAHSAVMTTARGGVRTDGGAHRAGPFDSGSGHLHPGRPNQPGSVFNPGLVYDAELRDYLGFLCDADPEVFEDPDAACAELAAAGVPVSMVDLNYPSIGAAGVAGSLTVQRTITSVADRPIIWRATVSAPPGFTVTVSPRKLRLAPGESATVTIELSHRAGGTGQWQFGSLTWQGGGYRVHSPIAVLPETGYDRRVSR